MKLLVDAVLSSNFPYQIMKHKKWLSSLLPVCVRGFFVSLFCLLLLSLFLYFSSDKQNKERKEE